MSLEEQFAWRGRRIAWGRMGSGPPVVFCHGTPWSSLVWAPFAEGLSDDFTVYLWDMAGYGESSKAAEHRVDFGVQAELFAALLSEWELDRPRVVAHDFGGAVSLRAHLLLGVPLGSLMLVDVVAIPPTGSPFFRFVQEHPDVMPRLPPYIHNALVKAYIESASHRGLRPEDLSRLVAPWTGDQGQPAFYRQIAQTDERYLEEIEPRLGKIDIPVRIVWGKQDTWIPHEVGLRLGDLIPPATVELVDGAGHLVQYDAPVALANELRTWLTG